MSVVSDDGIGLDVTSLRGEFPALDQEVHPGYPLAYLDSAATSLKPRVVLEAVRAYDAEYPANVHRGIHRLSERATEAFENARHQVARFLGVNDPDSVVFTGGCTDGINLVAQSWGRAQLRPGDRILLTLLEHHSNIVPWQMVAEATGASVEFVGLDGDGRLDLDDFRARLNGPGPVRMLALTGMSNVLGVVPPVDALVQEAHRVGALVLVDAAQSGPHLSAPNSPAHDADFFVLSGHKLCGPSGIGALWGRRELLEAMPPSQGGGGMIGRVTTEGSTWADPPAKFEAGTPPIAQAIGLGTACAFLDRVGRPAIERHERELLEHAHRVLPEIPGFRALGPFAQSTLPEDLGGIISFTVEGVHPHDLAQLIDRAGVALRAGHHCAMPLHQHLEIAASARASLFLYNTVEEVDRLALAIRQARKLFRLDP